MARHYDLAVIGSGTAAQMAAGRVRKAGWTVAVIDHQPFGGTCALRGCDPKKVLISGAEAIDAASRMRGHGVTRELSIDWRELIAFKRSFTDTVHDIGPLVEDEIARRSAMLGGLTWHFCRPPVIDLDFEMDVRAPARELIL